MYSFNLLSFYRIWYRPRNHTDHPGPTQIGVLNFVPACVDPGGVFKRATYTTVAETIAKANEYLASNPLSGNRRYF